MFHRANMSQLYYDTYKVMCVSLQGTSGLSCMINRETSTCRTLWTSAHMLKPKILMTRFVMDHSWLHLVSLIINWISLHLPTEPANCNKGLAVSCVSVDFNLYLKPLL